MSKIWDGQEKHTHTNIMENRKYSLVCNNDPNLMGVQGKYFFKTRSLADHITTQINGQLYFLEEKKILPVLVPTDILSKTC